MEARLVTSPHQYTLPRVREVPSTIGTTSATDAEKSRTLSQRERVAASLLACPNGAGRASKQL
jgi:hypothetical protein